MPLNNFEEDGIFIQYSENLSEQHSGRINAVELELDELYERYGIEALIYPLNKIPKSGNEINFTYSGLLSLPDEVLAEFLSLIPPWISTVLIGVSEISEEKKQAILNAYSVLNSKDTENLSEADYQHFFEEKESIIINQIDSLTEALKDIKNADLNAFNKFSILIENIKHQFNLIKENPELFFSKKHHEAEFQTVNNKKFYLKQNKFAVLLNLLEECSKEIKEWKTKQESLKGKQIEPVSKLSEHDGLTIEETHEAMPEQAQSSIEAKLDDISQPFTDEKRESKSRERASEQVTDQKQQEKQQSSQKLWLRLFKPKMNEVEQGNEEALLDNRFSFATKTNSDNYVDFSAYSHFKVMQYNKTNKQSYLWTAGLGDCVAIGLIIHSDNNEPKKAILYHSVSEHGSIKSINKTLANYDQGIRKEKHKFIYAIYDFLKTIESNDEIEAVIYSNTHIVKDINHPDVVRTREIIEGCLHYLGKENIKLNIHPLCGESGGFFLTPSGIAGLIV